ncbi:hypothetical protein KC799_13620 [candidate division KSB1 bacterium]|nr:hypothetical protein [candidate division KSB1 bacterium]
MRFKILSVTILSICSLAYGQNQSSHRSGLFFGNSIGISRTSHHFPYDSQINSDLALEAKIGYFIKPDFALTLITNPSIYNYNGSNRERKREFGVLAASAQYWFGSKKTWILGGIGLGVDAPVFYDVKPEGDGETKYFTGFGFVSSIGYEFYKWKKLVFDAEARVTYRNVEMEEGKTTGTSIALLLGFNFY